MTSLVCGYYALYFLYFRSRGRTMKEIQATFSRNKQANDAMVKQFVQKYIPQTSRRRKSRTDQCCVSQGQCLKRCKKQQ